MNKLVIQVLAVLIALSTIFYYYKKVDGLRIENSRLTNNNKSLERGMLTFRDDSARTHTLTLQQQKTISELKYASDSTTIALVDRLKEYKIKLKDVRAVQTMKTVFKHDTTVRYVAGRDTTYNLSHLPHVKHTVSLKGDQLKDSLRIYNTQDVILQGKKETIDPPKKFFLWRWFQAKHIVISGEVINSNPYIDVTEQKFIKTIPD